MRKATAPITLIPNPAPPTAPAEDVANRTDVAAAIRLFTQSMTRAAAQQSPTSVEIQAAAEFQRIKAELKTNFE